MHHRNRQVRALRHTLIVGIYEFIPLITNSTRACAGVRTAVPPRKHNGPQEHRPLTRRDRGRRDRGHACRVVRPAESAATAAAGSLPSTAALGPKTVDAEMRLGRSALRCPNSFCCACTTRGPRTRRERRKSADSHAGEPSVNPAPRDVEEQSLAVPVTPGFRQSPHPRHSQLFHHFTHVLSHVPYETVRNSTGGRQECRRVNLSFISIL